VDLKSPLTFADQHADGPIVVPFIAENGQSDERYFFFFVRRHCCRSRALYIFTRTLQLHGKHSHFIIVVSSWPHLPIEFYSQIINDMPAIRCRTVPKSKTEQYYFINRKTKVPIYLYLLAVWWPFVGHQFKKYFMLLSIYIMHETCVFYYYTMSYVKRRSL